MDLERDTDVRHGSLIRARNAQGKLDGGRFSSGDRPYHFVGQKNQRPASKPTRGASVTPLIFPNVIIR